MVVAPVDMKIVNTKEMRVLLEQYEKKFGERFIMFNYGDFCRIGDKPAGQVYKEALIAALEKDEPTRIESHRYDDFDH